MVRSFQIGVNPAPELLAAPPPDLLGVPFLYCPIAVRVKGDGFPAPFWCDFAGVLLWKWFRHVWKLSQYESRFGRLVFYSTYEIWLRRTTKHWWNLSFVERTMPLDSRVMEEHLVIPERVEAALLTAIQRLLTGARRVGRWTEDCEALKQALNDPKDYWTAIEAGDISPPSFISGSLKRVLEVRQAMRGVGLPPTANRNGNSRLGPLNAAPLKPRDQHRFAPLFCPRCNAVLPPWREHQTRQTCLLCSCEISRA